MSQVLTEMSDKLCSGFPHERFKAPINTRYKIEVDCFVRLIGSKKGKNSLIFLKVMLVNWAKRFVHSLHNLVTLIKGITSNVLKVDYCDPEII